MKEKDLDSLVHDNHVETMGTYNDWTPIRTSGDIAACKELYKEGRTKLQDLIDDTKRLGFNNQINRREFNRSDGSKIIVEVNFGNPLIKIYVPPKKGGKEYHGGYFQCDLFTDHPDFPEEISQQVKTSIAFKVVTTPDWFLIPERQGNMEWSDGKSGLFSFDCVQNWARGILNKRAWNDSMLGPFGESVAFPYDPRPQHAKRDGEISTIVDDYPDVNEEYIDRYLAVLDRRMVFEPAESVQKQYFFIDGVKYSPILEYGNQYVMGGCVHTTNKRTQFCVFITQVFWETPGIYGTASSHEEVWYFKLEGNVTPTPILIDNLYYTDPPGLVYTFASSDITPWDFSPDGTSGKALRAKQYHCYHNVWNWMQRDNIIVNLHLEYSELGVTATHDIEDVIIPHVTYVRDGGWLFPTYEERGDWLYSRDLQAYNIAQQLPDIRYFQGDMDYQYVWGERDELTGEFTQARFHYFTSSLYNDVDLPYHSTQDQVATLQYQLGHNGAETHRSDQYTVKYLRPEPEKGSVLGHDLTNMIYVGGSPKHNVAFYIKIHLNQYRTEYDEISDSNYDFAYIVTLNVVCLFKGIYKEIGSPIVYSVPSVLFIDNNNAQYNTHLTPREAGYYKLRGPWSVCNTLSSVESNISFSSFTDPLGASGIPHVGDLGGSIKCSTDGTHVVISCSYMDIAKYIFPWHRSSYDNSPSDVPRSSPTRIDNMDKLGVPQELQEAWNKYMINYAIIPHELTEAGITESKNNLSSYVGPSGADGPATNTGTLNTGSSNDGSKNEGDIDVLQLSNLLFGKIVDDELPTPSDNHDDYEFGIKEKDTTAFLPIGIYGKPEEEE